MLLHVIAIIVTATHIDVTTHNSDSRNTIHIDVTTHNSDPHNAIHINNILFLQKTRE